MISAPLLTVAVFKHKRDTFPRPHTLTWENLCDKLTKHAKRESKDGSLWAPTAYEPGALRENANVISVSCYVADVDDGTTPAELASRWVTPGGEPLAWVLHSSHSSTAEKPKYRVVFPLSASVPGSEWKATHRKLSLALFGEHTDPACKDVSRMYYTPAAPEATFGEAFADKQGGAFLDPGAFPDPVEDEATAATVGYIRRQGKPLGTGSGDKLPGEDYNRQADSGEVLRLLQSLGWQEETRRGDGVIEVRRPGKSSGEGISGTIGYVGDDPNVFYCFTSSSAPFEGSRAYSPFAVYAFSRTNGDFKEAARRLGADGYGEQRKPIDASEAKRTADAMTQPRKIASTLR